MMFGDEKVDGFAVTPGEYIAIVEQGVVVAVDIFHTLWRILDVVVAPLGK
jgi:hypothetical protein